jgi:dienelactone hydrolase
MVSKSTTFFKQHKQHIQQECNDSIETALLEEDLETIDIMTDARHGWHNNAKDTSVASNRR